MPRIYKRQEPGIWAMGELAKNNLHYLLCSLFFLQVFGSSTDLVVDVHVHGDAEALVVGVVARQHLHVLLLVAKVLDPPREVALTHVLGRYLKYMVGMKSGKYILNQIFYGWSLAS